MVAQLDGFVRICFQVGPLRRNGRTAHRAVAVANGNTRLGADEFGLWVSKGAGAWQESFARRFIASGPEPCQRLAPGTRSSSPWRHGSCSQRFLLPSLCPRAMRRIVPWTILLSVALGSVYWLKYSGIFLSIAILGAVVLEQIRGFEGEARGTFRRRLCCSMAIAFIAPVLALKAWNYSISGSDFVETLRAFQPAQNGLQNGGAPRGNCLRREHRPLCGTIRSRAGRARSGHDLPERARLAGSGARACPVDHLPTPDGSQAGRLYPKCHNPRRPCSTRRLPCPELSRGAAFQLRLGRCCEPYWILFELLIFVLLSQNAPEIRVSRPARLALAATAIFQIFLFLWIPVMWGRLFWLVLHSPHYDAGAADLWDTDLSKYGTREIDERVKSLLRGPGDVVAPAVYSESRFRYRYHARIRRPPAAARNLFRSPRANARQGRSQLLFNGSTGVIRSGANYPGGPGPLQPARFQAADGTRDAQVHPGKTMGAGSGRSPWQGLDLDRRNGLRAASAPLSTCIGRAPAVSACFP